MCKKKYPIFFPVLWGPGSEEFPESWYTAPGTLMWVWPKIPRQNVRPFCFPIVKLIQLLVATTSRPATCSSGYDVMSSSTNQRRPGHDAQPLLGHDLWPATQTVWSTAAKQPFHEVGKDIVAHFWYQMTYTAVFIVSDTIGDVCGVWKLSWEAWKIAWLVAPPFQQTDSAAGALV